MLDERQAFKAAFLHHCLQQGLSLDDTHDVVKTACEKLSSSEKTARIPVLSTIDDILGNTAKGLAHSLPKVGLTAAIGAPVVAGGLAGAGIASLEGINDEDPSEIKTQEKIEAYRRIAARANLQKQLRKNREARRPSRPLL